MNCHFQATALNWPTWRNFFNFFFFLHSGILYSILNQFQYRVQEDMINLLHKIYIKKLCILNLKSQGENEQNSTLCALLAGGRGENQFLFFLLIFQYSKNLLKMRTFFASRRGLQVVQTLSPAIPP